MARRRNRWAASSNWDSIMFLTEGGDVEEIRPSTKIYLTSNKGKTHIATVGDFLDGLFHESATRGIEDPWHHAVSCLSSLVMAKQMKIHDPRTGRIIGRASLIPPRSMQH